MKKRIVVAVVLAVLVALALTGCLSTNTQTKDFFELVTAGTPQDVQAAINNGADVNARNEVGDTALTLAAAYNKSPEVIATLQSDYVGVKNEKEFKVCSRTSFNCVSERPDCPLSCRMLKPCELSSRVRRYVD